MIRYIRAKLMMKMARKMDDVFSVYTTRDNIIYFHLHTGSTEKCPLYIIYSLINIVYKWATIMHVNIYYNAGQHN